MSIGISVGGKSKKRPFKRRRQNALFPNGKCTMSITGRRMIDRSRGIFPSLDFHFSFNGCRHRLTSSLCVHSTFQSGIRSIVKSRSQGGLGFTWNDFGSSEQRKGRVETQPGQHSFTTPLDMSGSPMMCCVRRVRCDWRRAFTLRGA